MVGGVGSVIVLWVELSRENLPLALGELQGALEALGGRIAPSRGPAPIEGVIAVEVGDEGGAQALAARLAFGRRVLLPWSATGAGGLEGRLGIEGRTGRSAAFRPLGGDQRPLPGPEIHALAASYAAGGGRIDLAQPDRRFWIVPLDPGGWALAEEFASIDRAAYEARRMPHLPFQRPVSLPPRRARAAVNLAAVRPGHQVVDPFVGTGALLLEAALVGARVSGVDRDPDMVRGSIRNLTAFGRSAESLTVGDAGDPFPPPGGGGWDAIVTDPPYGRASGSGGEPPEELIRRVLPAWTQFLAPEARVSIVLPGGVDPLGPPWVLAVSIPDRVHRSLTREFRVYRRGPDSSRP
jgi:hypothetical protein